MVPLNLHPYQKELLKRFEEREPTFVAPVWGATVKTWAGAVWALFRGRFVRPLDV